MAMDIDKLYFVSKCILLDKENKFLILKRTDYKNNNTGDIWDIPGGSVNLDEDVNLAVRRELREEIKIEVIDARPIIIESGKGVPSGQFIFTIFCSTNYDLKKGITLSEEHSEYKWITADEIKNYKFYLTQERMNKIKEYLNSLK